MATNIYDLEERIGFNPEKPTVFYGWYISTSGSELKVSHFKRAELRDEMTAEVAALFPKSKDDAELIAACMLIRALGGDGSDSDFAESIVMYDILPHDPDYDKFGKKWDALCGIADKYAENYE